MSRTMSRIALSLFSAALITVSLASCGSDVLNIPEDWTLQTVGGVALPFTVTNSEHDVVITSGTASLNSDNTYSFTFTGTVDGDAGQAGSDHGHWSIGNSTFTFQSAVIMPNDYIAALTGAAFRVAMPGQVVGSTDQNFDMVFGRDQ